MFRIFINWLRQTYDKTINSIAFLPALIAFGFLLLSFAMLLFDASGTGKHLKSNLHWVSLKDANTARSICSAIAAGIISLSVFSFSMVMIVLNQAASQMSNRVLDKLISNRFQQSVLGFYIGTIIYALFLLSTIRDVDSGIYVPALSTYVLIALTVLDIFLFIYFLHYITDSVKYETIIGKLHAQTMSEMAEDCRLTDEPLPSVPEKDALYVTAHKSGIFQGFDRKALMRLCSREQVIVGFLYPKGRYVLKGTPLYYVHGTDFMPKDFEELAALCIHIGPGQRIDTDYYNGFRQLMEVAVKALSPGINDPDTAVLALQALFDLIAFRKDHHAQTHLTNEDGNLRILTVQKPMRAIFEEFLYPIWDYGKNDRSVVLAFDRLVAQLESRAPFDELPELLALMKSSRGFAPPQA